MKKNRLFLSAVLAAFLLSTSASAFAADEKGKTFGGLTREELITLEELHEAVSSEKPPLILDARNKKSYDEGHIPHSLLPLSRKYYKDQELFRLGMLRQAPDSESALAAGMRRYSKKTPIVTYCSDDCQASVVLLQRLKKLGFENVRAAEKGFQSWEKMGYPVSKSLTRASG